MFRIKHRGILWLVAILLIVVTLLVTWYCQNFTFCVSKTTIHTNKVTSPVTVAHISDLHGARYGKNNEKLINALKKQKPDLICVTGDMYTNGDKVGKETALSFMSDALSIAPVYFVNGEHDSDADYLAKLADTGVRVLSYEWEKVTVRENQLTLYGIDNVYYTDTFNLFREFDKPPEESYNILLAHIPNFEAFNWFGPDLTLCGDTHGGVAQIPFLGPLYFNGHWFPELTNGDEYVTDKGLFDTFTGHVYVSGGLGNYPYPLRVMNRPELSVIQIVPEE